MIKAILFDADGVAIQKRDRFFSERFAEAQGVPIEGVIPFFKHEMREAFVDLHDIKDSLAHYLPEWKWVGTVDEFLAHWFKAESPRDEVVLRYIDELRKHGNKCYLATDRERYWAEFLVEEVRLKDHFDGFMFSYEIGYEKHVKEYFLAVTKRLGLEPDEIMYWDDDQKNVDVAKSVGIDAYFYTDLDTLKRDTVQLLR
jgi:putative hydrolase of the HAD superfamily